MNLNQKIVLLVLGIAFHGGIMGMEGHKKYYLLPNTDIAKQALYVARSVHKGIQQFDMIMVATWLEGKRNTIPDKEWKSFVYAFVDAMRKLDILCVTDLERRKFRALGGAINWVAVGLKPGEDCSKELVEHVKVVISSINYPRGSEEILGFDPITSSAKL